MKSWSVLKKVVNVLRSKRMKNWSVFKKGRKRIKIETYEKLKRIKKDWKRIKIEKSKIETLFMWERYFVRKIFCAKGKLKWK
jgi:hypothetical protein